jgi:hypothetical protein
MIARDWDVWEERPGFAPREEKGRGSHDGVASWPEGRRGRVRLALRVPWGTTLPRDHDCLQGPLHGVDAVCKALQRADPTGRRPVETGPVWRIPRLGASPTQRCSQMAFRWAVVRWRKARERRLLGLRANWQPPCAVLLSSLPLTALHSQRRSEDSLGGLRVHRGPACGLPSQQHQQGDDLLIRPPHMKHRVASPQSSRWPFLSEPVLIE